MFILPHPCKSLKVEDKTQLLFASIYQFLKKNWGFLDSKQERWHDKITVTLCKCQCILMINVALAWHFCLSNLFFHSLLTLVLCSAVISQSDSATDSSCLLLWDRNEPQWLSPFSHSTWKSTFSEKFRMASRIFKVTSHPRTSSEFFRNLFGRLVRKRRLQKSITLNLRKLAKFVQKISCSRYSETFSSREKSRKFNEN